MRHQEYGNEGKKNNCHRITQTANSRDPDCRQTRRRHPKTRWQQHGEGFSPPPLPHTTTAVHAIEYISPVGTPHPFLFLVPHRLTYNPKTIMKNDVFVIKPGEPRLRQKREDDGQREHGAGPPPLVRAPGRIPERARRLGRRPPRGGARLPDGAHFQPIPVGDPGHVVRADADWNSLRVEKIEQVWRRGAGGPQAAVFSRHEEHDAAACDSGLGANAERSAPGGFSGVLVFGGRGGGQWWWWWWWWWWW